MYSKAVAALCVHCLLATASAVVAEDLGHRATAALSELRHSATSKQHRRSPTTLIRSEAPRQHGGGTGLAAAAPQILTERSAGDIDDAALKREEQAPIDEEASPKDAKRAEADDGTPTGTLVDTSSTCCGSATVKQVGIEGQAANSAVIAATARETAKDARALVKASKAEVADLAAINDVSNLTGKLLPCSGMANQSGCAVELAQLAKLDKDDRAVETLQAKVKNDAAKLQAEEALQLKADEQQAKIETQGGAAKIAVGGVDFDGPVTTAWADKPSNADVGALGTLAKEAKTLAKDALALQNAENKALQDASGCNTASKALDVAKSKDALDVEAAAARVKAGTAIVVKMSGYTEKSTVDEVDF